MPVMDYVQPKEVNESIAAKVITRVAHWKGVDPVELQPLSNAINPDALDALFAGTGRNGQISFEYGGCEVIVEDSDQVVVQDRYGDSGSTTDTAASREG